jgi:hypothetical protein
MPALRGTRLDTRRWREHPVAGCFGAQIEGEAACAPRDALIHWHQTCEPHDSVRRPSGPLAQTRSKRALPRTRMYVSSTLQEELTPRAQRFHRFSNSGNVIEVRAAIEPCGVDRVVFSSDFSPVPYGIKEHMQIVEDVLPNPAERELVCWKTSNRIFRLGLPDTDRITPRLFYRWQPSRGLGDRRRQALADTGRAIWRGPINRRPIVGLMLTILPAAGGYGNMVTSEVAIDSSQCGTPGTLTGKK